MKAIETYYNGYRFRSRLEARWAVFFDALGVKYEYEPEGFDLGNGLYYLPDFLIRNVMPRYGNGDYLQNIYVEVKGKPNSIDAKKIARFADEHPIWVVGSVPDPDNYIESCHEEHMDYCYSPAFSKDGCVFCPYCYGTIDHDTCFEFSLGFDNGTLSFHGADNSYGFGDYYNEIRDALLAARQARFEHGECG